MFIFFSAHIWAGRLVKKHERVDFFFEVGQFGNLFFYENGQAFISFVIFYLNTLLELLE